MAKLVAQYAYSAAELLALVEEAIAYCTQNQSYTLRGKTYTRANLTELIEWRDRLIQEVAGTSTRPSHTYVEFHSRKRC